MALGLFGKLPARRDFIAVGVARPLLTMWELWIEAGLRAGQDALGEEWTAAYERAPVWRFWMGSAVCGEPVLGALIPSSDGIGRYYPLTLFATGDLAPPDVDRREDWFAAAETFLRAARGWERDYALTLEDLERLPPPSTTWPDGAGAVQRMPAGFLLRHEEADEALALPRLGMAGRQLQSAHSSYWWTKGGAGRQPQAVLLPAGPPDASFLTGLVADIWPQAEA